MINKKPYIPHILKQHATALSVEPTREEVYLYPCLRILSLEWQLDFQFQEIRRIAHRNAILDFYFPSAKLAVEIDGGYHSTDNQRRRDAERDRLLKQEHGIDTLRLSNAQVREDRLNATETIVDAVLIRIKGAQRKRIKAALAVQRLRAILEAGFAQYSTDKLRYHSPLEKRHHRKAEVPYSPYATGVVTAGKLGGGLD